MEENKEKERGLDTVTWRTVELKRNERVRGYKLKKKQSEEGRKY